MWSGAVWGEPVTRTDIFEHTLGHCFGSNECFDMVVMFEGRYRACLAAFKDIGLLNRDNLNDLTPVFVGCTQVFETVV
jgi:hypothetical protein